MKGSLEQAVGYWRESLHFRPDGAVLARLGRTREAAPEFETALRLNPNLEASRRNLETTRSHLEKPTP
jgi:predicted RNA polymerase sigma factor